MTWHRSRAFASKRAHSRRRTPSLRPPRPQRSKPPHNARHGHDTRPVRLTMPPLLAAAVLLLLVAAPSPFFCSLSAVKALPDVDGPTASPSPAATAEELNRGAQWEREHGAPVGDVTDVERALFASRSAACAACQRMVLYLDETLLPRVFDARAKHARANTTPRAAPSSDPSSYGRYDAMVEEEVSRACQASAPEEYALKPKALHRNLSKP